MGARNDERRRRVAEMLEAGRSVGDIARELGVSKPTVCHYARSLGIPPREPYARRYDWTEVQRFYDAGRSPQECIAHFGFSRHTFWDAIRRGVLIPRPRAEPICDILVAGRKRSRTHVKQRLLASGLKVNRCDECGIEDWRGEPLAMELHHVNGDGQDNRLANLRLLCPNCHAQTPNYSGRALRRAPAA